ncbi:hypothetical protein [Desulfosporosinus shakirovi]|uniref:hypothetical protein n=1 Tax=Desulfosporosinus shakirovi TaxID=2885154 RepID=UPI001E4C80DC|nr:hypothetical protein [Desulfosporosinus sp. SRJS8]MCB8818669.1 hypothetical protein [Desulfosporosinus sp. SRJS8]
MCLMNHDIAFEIEWRKLLISKMARTLNALKKNSEAEKAAILARQTKISELYPTAQEAHDAYGYGYITEDEYRTITKKLASVDIPTATSAASDELRDIVSRLKKQIRDLEWEALPESEREAIRLRTERHVSEIKQAKEVYHRSMIGLKKYIYL